MSATVTINLDAEVLERAERQAKAHQTSIPEIVAMQLSVMADNWRDSADGKTPLTDLLRGAVQLPAGLEFPEALSEELSKKHGGAN